MKRRNIDISKLRGRPMKRSKIGDSLYGSTLLYLRCLVVWVIIVLLDFILEFRFEFLWPFYLLLRSVYDSFRYQGLTFSIFFIFLALLSDMLCYFLIPVHWLLFAASTYVWVQFVWQSDKGICAPTVVLWALFVYLETAVRLRDVKHLPGHLDLCRPFAAHCIGYPVVTLGFAFKSYIGFHIRRKKQRDVAKENDFYVQLMHQALPMPAAVNSAQESTMIDTVKSSTLVAGNSSNNTHANSSGAAATVSGGGGTMSNGTIANGVIKNGHANGSVPRNGGRKTASQDKEKYHSSVKGQDFCLQDMMLAHNVCNKTHHHHQQHNQHNGGGDHIVVNSGRRATTTTSLDEDYHSVHGTTTHNAANTTTNTNSTTCSTLSSSSSSSTSSSSTPSISNLCAKCSNNINNHAQNNSARSHSNSGLGNGQSFAKGKRERREQESREREAHEYLQKLENDSKKLRSELQLSRSSEQELRLQVATLTTAEKVSRGELTAMQRELDDLQQRVQNMQSAKAYDKQTISSLERRVTEERRLRCNLEAQLNHERKSRKEEVRAAQAAAAQTPRGECTEACKAKRRDLEKEVQECRQTTHLSMERSTLLERENKKLQEQLRDHELVLNAYTSMQEKNAHLADSLSAETRIKLDLFSALGEAKRQIEIRENSNRLQEKEIEELKSKIAQVLAVMPHDSFSGAAQMARICLDSSPGSNLDPNAIAYTPKSTSLLATSTEA